jgi:hypothetical protein
MGENAFDRSKDKELNNERFILWITLAYLAAYWRRESIRSLHKYTAVIERDIEKRSISEIRQQLSNNIKNISNLLWIEVDNISG